MKKTQYVVKRGNEWAVKGENNKRATRVVKTQSEAIEIARNIARNRGAELRVQDMQGRFRTCNSYGNDPNPPKDVNR